MSKKTKKPVVKSVAQAKTKAAKAAKAAKDTSTKAGRPATGQTPKRYFRIKDESWNLIIAASQAQGGTISDYLRKVLVKDAEKVLKKGK